MLQKDKKERNQLEFVSIETLMPKDHVLRKIDSAIDFTRIYDFVEELYCADNGRPSIDPVVLFKMVLIQHLFGINQTLVYGLFDIRYCIILFLRFADKGHNRQNEPRKKSNLIPDCPYIFIIQLKYYI